MERRPRLPPCFPTSTARANSSPASRPIVEGLRSAIFAAYAAIVEEDGSSAPSTIDANPHWRNQGHDDIGDGTLDRAVRATAQEMEEHRLRWLSP